MSTNAKCVICEKPAVCVVRIPGNSTKWGSGPRCEEHAARAERSYPGVERIPLRPKK